MRLHNNDPSATGHFHEKADYTLIAAAPATFGAALSKTATIGHPGPVRAIAA